MCQELRWWVKGGWGVRMQIIIGNVSMVSINQIFSFTLIKCFQWLTVALQIQTLPQAGEEDRRSPADWKHLGDCREHSHIIQRWLRFDSALWSDSFDLGQCACVQLPETGLAEKEDRARRSRHWMVPLLLMGTLLTANVSVGVKCNQLVDAFTKKVTIQQLFRTFGAHCWDVCHNLLFLRGLAALCISFSFKRGEQWYTVWSLGDLHISMWSTMSMKHNDYFICLIPRNFRFFHHRLVLCCLPKKKKLPCTQQNAAAFNPMIFSRCTLLFQTDVSERSRNIVSRQCLLDLTCLQLSDRLQIVGMLIMISGTGFALAKENISFPQLLLQL